MSNFTELMLQFPHDAARAQIIRAKDLARELGGGKLVINSQHYSKSIKLPVPTIILPGLSFTFRDNFHDLNLLVECDKMMDIPLDFLYKPQSFEWYMEAINSKRGYSYRDWSDDEMNNPQVLRVQRKRGTPGWQEISGDEKDRWAERMTSTEWYTHDWSSGVLITTGPNNPFDASTTFYHAPRAYAEGIVCEPWARVSRGDFKPYTKPCKSFLNCINGWDEMVSICKGIANSVKLPDETKDSYSLTAATLMDAKVVASLLKVAPAHMEYVASLIPFAGYTKMTVEFMSAVDAMAQYNGEPLPKNLMENSLILDPERGKNVVFFTRISRLPDVADSPHQYVVETFNN